ncbi:Aste57867_6391 [Aphanomyces stellatus]|uniref:Aste57867_6391 protein n=1 Tax=Aphanomyces stellatus TaxID=120398 RepID=A0A485KH81_9STRA|nr:hypothetical protein As57867_006376 [Aphanomyces stellatus]VFT83386.1 Aste57867_6391 [Aphanomyces stellatus]
MLEQTFSKFSADARNRAVWGFLAGSPAFHVATLQWPNDESQVGLFLVATGAPLTPSQRHLCVVTALVAHIICPLLAVRLPARPRHVLDRAVLRSADFM